MTYTGTVNSFDTLRIHHNEIYDFHADSVKLTGEGISFYNNTIRDRGTYRSDHPDGIQAWSGYLKIYNNTFYGFHRYDDNNVNSYIRYNPDGNTGHNGNPVNFWVYNNLFYEAPLPLSFSGTNYRRGIELSFGDPTLSTVNHVYFMNNTIVGTNFFGLYIGFRSVHSASNVSDIIIANNLFKDASVGNNGDYGADVVIMLGNDGDGTITYGTWGESVDVIVDYNTVYASSATYSTDCYYDGTSYSWADFKTASVTSANPSNATQNPFLTEDYKLQPNSQYINAGINLSSYFVTDKDGISHPQGSAWDIGAYEYVGAPDTTPPAAPTGLSII